MIDRIDRSWLKTNPLTPYISRDKIISWKALPILGLLGSALLLAYFLNQSRVSINEPPKDLQLPGIHPTKLEKYKALIKKHLSEGELLGKPTKDYSEATSIALGQQLTSEKSNSCNNQRLDLRQVILGFNEQALKEDKDLISYNEQLAQSEEGSDCHNHFKAFIQEKIEFLYKKDEHYIIENKTCPQDQSYDRTCKIVCVEGYYIPIVLKLVH